MDAAIRQDQSLALWAAIVGSCLLHAVLIGLALRHLGEATLFSPAPTMSVELVPWRTERPPALKRAARPEPAPAPSRPEALARPPSNESPTANAVLPPAGLAPGVRRALRGLTGCDRLPREERDTCHDRLAATGQDDPTRPPRLNLDPRGQFAENPEAYINRKPKNGCKLRAAGEAGALVQKDGARAAFSCAWDF